MDLTCKLWFLLSYISILLTTQVQSKINLKSSPSTSIAFGQRIGASISSYSLPIFNLGSSPSNMQADCSGDALFGMYADLTSGCSSYHVCHGGRKDTFTCPEGTLFSQELMTCDYWYRVSCGSSNGEGFNYSPVQPPQQPQPQPPQTYYPSWSPPSEVVPSPGTYNPTASGSIPVFPQFPFSPPSPPSPPPAETYPSLTPPVSPERERPETEEEPRTIKPPTGFNPFEPSSSGPTLPIPVNPSLSPQYPQYPQSPQTPQYPVNPQYPQYPQYPSSFPQSPASPSDSSPPAGQQPPYLFNDWNQDEPEWTYAWMKKLDSSSDKKVPNGDVNNVNNKDDVPLTGQPFDFTLVNDKLGGPSAIKERSDSPNPWLFPSNKLYKKA